MANLVLTDRDGAITIVTLNRPDKRNALNAEMVDELSATLRQLGNDASTRVIVLRANGLAFCAGLDLSEMAAQRAAGEADLGGLEHVLETLEACPQPTIAAVQGDSVAGGCELALHCDIRVVGDSARFSMPLARIGLAVPIPLIWKLVDIVGEAKTNEMLFTGEGVGAETAVHLGLANRVVPDEELVSSVMSLAKQIEKNAPLAIRTMKAAVRRASAVRRQVDRTDLDEMHRQVRSSHDLQEGLAARREKRAPQFRGN